MGSVCQKQKSPAAFVCLTGVLFAALVSVLLPRFQSHLISAGIRIDLGNVDIGQNSERTFSIFNHSLTPVVIDGWSPSCRCMQANFPQQRIPPGSSIDAWVKTTATAPPGERAAVIAIKWHYAGENLARTDSFVVTAKYVATLLTSEEQLDFGDIRLGAEGTRVFNVTLDNVSARCNGLKTVVTSDRVSTKLVQTTSGFKILVQVNTHGIPAGVWKSTVTLIPLYNGKDTGKGIEIPIIARIRGVFSTSPPVLELTGKSGRVGYFTISFHSSGPPIRKIIFLGDVVQSPSITIRADGKNAVATGILAKPANKDLLIGTIPLQINDGLDGAMRLSFIAHSG